MSRTLKLLSASGKHMPICYSCQVQSYNNYNVDSYFCIYVCVNILYMQTMCKYCICEIINSTYVNILYMDYFIVSSFL